MGLPMPKFESAFGGVLVKIPRLTNVDDTRNLANDTRNGVDDTRNLENDTTNNNNDTGNLENDTRNLLLEIIIKEEGLTAPLLAEKINKSLSTTKRYIKELSDKVEFIFLSG